MDPPGWAFGIPIRGLDSDTESELEVSGAALGLSFDVVDDDTLEATTSVLHRYRSSAQAVVDRASGALSVPSADADLVVTTARAGLAALKGAQTSSFRGLLQLGWSKQCVFDLLREARRYFPMLSRRQVPVQALSRALSSMCAEELATGLGMARTELAAALTKGAPVQAALRQAQAVLARRMLGAESMLMVKQQEEEDDCCLAGEVLSEMTIDEDAEMEDTGGVSQRIMEEEEDCCLAGEVLSEMTIDEDAEMEDTGGVSQRIMEDTFVDSTSRPMGRRARLAGACRKREIDLDPGAAQERRGVATVRGEHGGSIKIEWSLETHDVMIGRSSAPAKGKALQTLAWSEQAHELLQALSRTLRVLFQGHAAAATDHLLVALEWARNGAKECSVEMTVDGPANPPVQRVWMWAHLCAAWEQAFPRRRAVAFARRVRDVELPVPFSQALVPLRRQRCPLLRLLASQTAKVMELANSVDLVQCAEYCECITAKEAEPDEALLAATAAAANDRARTLPQLASAESVGKLIASEFEAQTVARLLECVPGLSAEDVLVESQIRATRQWAKSQQEGCWPEEINSTPDILLGVPIQVEGATVHWIECKKGWVIPGLAPAREKHLASQLKRYRDAFGPGMVIWSSGVFAKTARLVEGVTHVSLVRV
jgi:hypothetical protein